jgi:L-rhamnose isomerase
MSSSAYASAREQFAAWGVDTDAALATLASTPVSLHCWQGDDVAGFENASGNAGSGCVATGNHPGKARDFAELTADLDQVARLVPGPLRLNLHASYATDNASRVDRDALVIGHFASWVDWAKQRRWGVDFNPTCFGHPLAASGFTLAHRDPAVRRFWIDHCVASRRIGAAFGRALGKPAVTNLWIPDGYKDSPADRAAPRRRLLESLDAIFAADLGPDAARHNLDAIESKLFGIGVESYTAGSHEFYLGYAVKNQIGYCLDAGHFHPTENIADKISSLLLFVPHLLFHVSRGVRWDSDHVVTLDDATRDMLAEVAQSGALDRIAIGMDFFDASINRIAAWVIGARNTKKALLLGLLQPRARLAAAEDAGDHAARLALQEDFRSLPWGAVWAEFCARHAIPGDGAWLPEAQTYENHVLAARA